MASSHDGLGGVSSLDDFINTGFDVFEVPEPRENIVSSRDVEFRLFTVLDRYEVIKYRNFQNEPVYNL